MERNQPEMKVCWECGESNSDLVHSCLRPLLSAFSPPHGLKGSCSLVAYIKSNIQKLLRVHVDRGGVFEDQDSAGVCVCILDKLRAMLR